MRGSRNSFSPSVRSRGSIGLAVCGTAVLLFLTLGAAPANADSPAPAAPLASPAPTSTPAPLAPTITSPSGGDLVTTGTVGLTGTGSPGDTIQVFVDAHGPECQAQVDTAGDWTCTVTGLADGPDRILSAVVVGDTSRSASVSVAALSPPTISGTSGASVSSGGVRGTAYPGAAVTVTISGGASCSFPADSTGSWGCVLPGPPASGTYTATATQRASFSSQSSLASAPFQLTIDSVAPSAPQLTDPAAGSSVTSGGSTLFRGVGENGATVTVYAGNDAGSAVLCTTKVSGTAWSCHGSLPPGRYTVSALQEDAAGNVSPASNTIALTFLAVPTPTTANGSAGDSSAPATGDAGQAAPVAPPAATATPSPRPPHATHGGLETWAGPTQFTDASPPTIGPAAYPGWLRSILLAAAALLLLALPARLLAVAVAAARADRAPGTRPRLFGRNRTRAELADDAPDAGEVSPRIETVRHRLVVGSAFVVAAALITMSSPVASPAAYLRVLVAVILALAVVNLAWLAVPRLASVHLTGHRIGVRFRPPTLLLVAATAIASRVFELEPALLFGILLGIAVTDRVGTIGRGRLAAAQVAALAGVGVVAWLVVGLLPDPNNPFSAFATEFTNSTSLLAVGSSAIALLPVGGFTGRAIFLWSRRVWGALSLAVYTLLFALLLPVETLWRTGAGTVLLAVGAAGFAGLSVAAWLWERFVEPAR